MRTALDATIDLSRVSFIATANDVDRIPRALLDRFRILRVPAPTEGAIFPQLAASIMEQLAVEDGVDPGFLQLLEQDELAVIAKAWRGRQAKSIRTLQKMIAATLDARKILRPRGTDMSMEDKQRIAEGEVALTLLFGGRKPSEPALKQAPLLDSWTVRMDRYGQRRMLSLIGFRRLTFGDLSKSPQANFFGSTARSASP